MATVRKNKKKKIIIIICIVLAIALIAVGASIYAKNAKIMQVSLYTIGTSDIYESVNATGAVSAGNVKEYKVDSLAVVKEVFVKVGDEVKQGDVLATFDTSSFDAQIEKLQATYNQAKSSYNSALSSQNEAKKNLAEVEKQISALEKEINALEKSIAKSTASTESSVNANLEAMRAALDKAIEQGEDVDIDALIKALEDALGDASNTAEGALSTQKDIAQLASDKLSLTAYKTQRQLYSSMASDTLVSSRKELMNTTKEAIDALKESQAELAAGWTAAFDGVVTDCGIVPGEQASFLSSGITLQNLNSMVVTVSLGEYDIHKVEVGMPVTITTAYGTYSGKVISKAPVAGGGSSASNSLIDSFGSMMGMSGLSSLTASGSGVEVKVSVDAPDENIIVGFDAGVEIFTGEHLGVVTVPAESMLHDKNGTYVYLYNEEKGTVTRTKIKTGAMSYTEYEITEGLKLGDRIISTPQSTFEETFEVKVAK